MRKAVVKRKTKETDIELTLTLESLEDSKITTGIGFFDHMLNSFAKHGRMKIEVKCNGDLHVDDHHTVEDIGICLGKAFNEALGDKKGIYRFGFASVPMDEALCQTSVDLSGRPFLIYNCPDTKGYIKDYNLEMTREFWNAFTFNANINFHVNVLYGDNTHHINEAMFKACGIALYNAFKKDDNLNDIILSTKGKI